MRTEQERMELIRNRTLEIRRKEQKRRQRTQDFGCVAACVILIACLGILMPQVANQPAYAIDGFFPGAASIFGNNRAQGYILMGTICFLLGVCVTVLLYRLHRKNREKKSDEF